MVDRWWTLKSICSCLGVLDINEGIGLEACCKPLYTLMLSGVKVGKLPGIERTLHSIRRNVNVNLFTHGAPRSSKNSFRSGRAFQDRTGIWKCWFLRRGENRSTQRKTSRSRVENQQQTQPTYDAGSGSRTRDTLVGGERSHHCANPAPLKAVITVT